MPRFALLRHECPAGSLVASHWDLLLEAEGALLTWRLAELPDAAALTAPWTLAAERLPDHRLLYLDYQGPISNDRGFVEQVDAGPLKWLERAANSLRFCLQGRRWNGEFTLRQPAGESAGECWRLSFAPSCG